MAVYVMQFKLQQLEQQLLFLKFILFVNVFFSLYLLCGDVVAHVM